MFSNCLPTLSVEMKSRDIRENLLTAKLAPYIVLEHLSRKKELLC